MVEKMLTAWFEIRAEGRDLARHMPIMISSLEQSLRVGEWTSNSCE